MSLAPSRRVRVVLFSTVLLLLAGCDEPAAAGVVIKADGSGAVVVCCTRADATPSEIETAGEGVAWSDRTRVVCSTGTFKNLAESPIMLGDIRVTLDGKEGRHLLSVAVPRGKNARWPALFTPVSSEDRDRLNRTRRAMDPDDTSPDKGPRISLKFTVPEPPRSFGATAGVPGAEVAASQKDVTLLLEVAKVIATDGTPPLILDITW